MEIGVVGAELFHADRKTHRRSVGPSDGSTDGWADRRDEANGRFLQFYERP
jgi:hypothetical protein